MNCSIDRGRAILDASAAAFPLPLPFPFFFPVCSRGLPLVGTRILFQPTGALCIKHIHTQENISDQFKFSESCILRFYVAAFSSLGVVLCLQAAHKTPQILAMK